MPSLGEAYISVHADTAPFQRELQAQVTKSTAAIEKAQNAPAARRASNPATSQETQNLKAQTARNKLLYKEDQAFKVAAAKEAAASIRQVNRDTALQIENDLRRQTAATKAATLAEKELARAAKDAADNHSGLGDKLKNLSSGLSRIGFTGQTRLLTLGLGVGAPIALLGAFAAAAAVATAAVTVFGIKSADAARSATLQFQSLGLTAAEAKAQFASLQALSNKGLQIANLDKDASLLLQLGINAQDTTKILSELGDIFSVNGDTGATLQKDIDDTAKKFATLVNTAKITPRTFQTAVASLGIGVTAQAAFDQVKKNLDVTTKQLDDIIAKGKLSGAALAQAALQAAVPGSAGALDKAKATSPTQALEALKSSAQSTLANAFTGSGTTIAGFISKVSDQLNGFLAKFAPRVIQTLSDTLPKLISALQPFGDALIATMQIVGPAFEAIGPIVTNLSGKISGFFSQVNVQGSGTQKLMHDLGVVFEEIGIVAKGLAPTLDAIGHGLADIAHDLAGLKPFVEGFSKAMSLLGGGGGILIEAITVFAAARVGIVLLNKALFAVAGAAFEGGIALKNFGNVAQVAGAQAAIAGAEIQAGTAAAVAGGIEKGAVKGFAASKLGKVLSGGAAKATIIIPLGIATYQIGYAAGQKLAEGLGAGASDSSKALQAAQDNATKMAPIFQTLSEHTDKLGVSLDFLSQYLNGASLAFIADTLDAGSFVNIAGSVVSALEAQGASAGQAARGLEIMGASTIDAQNAVNGIDTTVASAQLHALADQAIVAAGAMAAAGAVAQEIWSAQHNGTFGPITQAQGADALTAARSGKSSFTVPKLPSAGVGTGGSTGAGGASAAATKIKTAFSQLNDDLKAIADKTSEQTASQIKSEFKALIKDLDDSGNKSLDAGAKAVENRLLTKIKSLKTLKDKLAGELSIAQGVKDSAIGIGSIDGGSGIATTFFGIQNKLRFSVATTQQFLTAIKKLQSEKLNRTSIKQLVDNFASDPTGALAAAQALVGAGQVGITGAGGINDLQGQLTAAANGLGNDVAGEMYRAGLSAADGLLDGLKAKEKDLEAAINKIGDDLSKNMKKKIKAHSPSEVFNDIGGDVVDGLVGGIHGGAQKVAGAAAQMGQTLITFGPGSVAVNNADPKNPAGSGLMVGHGIVGILERQKTQAVLMGVG